jgi:hypothetical protein
MRDVLRCIAAMRGYEKIIPLILAFLACYGSRGLHGPSGGGFGGYNGVLIGLQEAYVRKRRSSRLRGW